MPLHAERKARRVGNPDRLDRAVLRNALDDHPFPRFENALTVQRIDADRLATEQPGKDPAGNETDVVTVGEVHTDTTVVFAVFQARHAMIHASWQFADFRMQ